MAPENVMHRDRVIAVSVKQGAEGLESDFCAVKRPHLDLLLSVLRQQFDYVGIWTAGCRDYAVKISREIFRDHYPPDFVLSHDNIVRYGPLRHEYHKPLRVFDTIHPGMLDPRFTLFVDDTKENFMENPDNGIIIPPFEPSPADPFNNSDRCFRHLINWLQSDTVRNSTDYRTLDKTTIFSCSKENCAKCAVVVKPMPSPYKLLFHPLPELYA